MPNDISAWLVRLGLDEYVSKFTDNDIDTRLLTQLTNEDLKELGVGSLGHRKTILNAIAALNEEDLPPAAVHKDEAERRQLTVMFCDLVGSTEMSQRLDPEDLRQLIIAYQGACNAAIARFDGYVARYMGDGLLVYLGYPAAHEDDAERAVRAGLEVVAEVAALDSPYDVELEVRIGIATGVVVAGDIVGEGASEERTVLGETPNLAARLQGIAQPGSVVIAAATRDLVEGRIEVEALEAVHLKGFSEPVQAYRAIAIQDASRFEAATIRGLTSFVSRESELQLLADRWHQACSGEGQVVLLSGEAGIGKSRMLRELREQLGTDSYTSLRYDCSPYGANTAFLPVIDALRSAAGFTKKDTDDDCLDKLEQLIRGSSNNVDTAGPLLAALMSLPGNRYPALDMTPMKQKLDTIAVLVEQLESLARNKPLMLLIEDVHWIDPSTLEVFDAFVERVQEMPVLMIVTHRPEFERRWEEYGHLTYLSLNRLSREHGRALAERVTGGRELPENVMAQILESTDGVPLFVEELVKTVLDSGVVREVDGRLESDRILPPMAIPTTLKDSLMARLDRLSPVKEVAQAAACIGREFSSTLLASIIDRDDLDENLDQLVASGLIFRRGSGDRNRYIFKHALVQDAAHESLLVNRRQQLHARIAQTIEASDDPDPAILAHHYATAEIHDKAAENHLAAGHRSIQMSALTEAIKELELGLKEIESMETSSTHDLLELDIRIALGTARMALFGWPHDSVSDAFERAFDLAEECGRQQAFGPILWGLCVHYWTRAEFPRTHYWLEKLEGVADRSDDSELSVVRDMTAGCQYFWEAKYERSYRYTVHIRETYDEQRHASIATYTNHDPLCFSLHWAGSLLQWITGYPDRGLEMVNEALELARRIEHPFNTVFALTAGSTCVGLRGEHERMLQQCDEAEEILEKQALGEFVQHVLIGHWRSQAQVQLGNFELAYQLSKLGNTGWHEAGGRLGIPWFWGTEALALNGFGRTQEALELINGAIAHCRSTGDCHEESEALRVKGELTLAVEKTDFNIVEAIFLDSLQVARDHKAKSYELRTATSLAKLWQSQDREPEARKLITPIFEWFTEGFDTVDLKAAKMLVEQLS